MLRWVVSSNFIDRYHLKFLQGIEGIQGSKEFSLKINYLKSYKMAQWRHYTRDSPNFLILSVFTLFCLSFLLFNIWLERTFAKKRTTQILFSIRTCFKTKISLAQHDMGNRSFAKQEDMTLAWNVQNWIYELLARRFTMTKKKKKKTYQLPF